MLKLPMCVVAVVLAPTVLWAEEFDDFDTEIFTTSLVQVGEEVEGLHLNVYRAIRDAKENPELAIGVSPSFADVADLGNGDKFRFAFNAKYGNKNGNTSLRLDAQPDNDDNKLSRFVWGFKWQLTSKLESGLHITPAIFGLDNNGWAIMLQRTENVEAQQLVNKLTVAGGDVYALGIFAFDYRLQYKGEVGQWKVVAELQVETQSEESGDNLAVELEPALQRDFGETLLRASVELGLAGDNKRDDIALQLTAARRFTF